MLVVGTQQYIEVHSTEVSFKLPRGFKSTPTDERTIAETFAHYLNGPLQDYRGKYGPYPKSAQSWILNNSNDYWLHFEGDTVRLTCRYEKQGEVIRTMAKLFLLIYGDRF